MKKYMYIRTNGYDMISVVIGKAAYILTDDCDISTFAKVYESEDTAGNARRCLEEVATYGDPKSWTNVITTAELEQVLEESEVIAALEEEATTKLYVADTQTGTFIAEVDSIEEAYNIMSKFEHDDRINNCYEEGFYDIVDEEHESVL